MTVDLVYMEHVYEMLRCVRQALLTYLNPYAQEYQLSARCRCMRKRDADDVEPRPRKTQLEKTKSDAERNPDYNGRRRRWQSRGLSSPANRNSRFSGCSTSTSASCLTPSTICHSIASGREASSGINVKTVIGTVKSKMNITSNIISVCFIFAATKKE
jgi:hypothetical protein